MSAYKNLIKRPKSDMTILELHVRYSNFKDETRDKAAEILAKFEQDLIDLHSLAGESTILNWRSLAQERIRLILDELKAKPNS
jgi:hypothetical protein